MVRELDRYPEEAFVFVREGLNYAVERVHGPESKIHQALAHYIHAHSMDWGDLIARYHSGDLEDGLVRAIEAAGGCDSLNRHVGGRELCWGLRDYAIERWGLMARGVLESWKVRSTNDFGRIVFALIRKNLLQKQEGDTIEDFDEVYEFDEAFDRRCYQFASDLGGRSPGIDN